jgi:hypothetical protein
MTFAKARGQSNQRRVSEVCDGPGDYLRPSHFGDHLLALLASLCLARFSVSSQNLAQHANIYVDTYQVHAFQS